MISAVAEKYGIHPQTPRMYEREGLIKPSRSEGNTRLYTEEDLERLEVVLELTRELGVNLAGVEIILNMREKMAAMQKQIEQFVQSLNVELAKTIRPEEPGESHSLIPVAGPVSVMPAEPQPQPQAQPRPRRRGRGAAG